ncbi:MAG: hypothetical protein WCQ99_06615 [Pseudomonadota bacterium]
MRSVTTLLFFWALMYAPAGILLGALGVFGVVPLYCRLRNISPAQQKIGLLKKTVLAALFAAVFVVTMCTISVYSLEKDKGDYLKSQGGWDSWRIPLVKPYELRMVNSMESGLICAWQSKEPIIRDVLRFIKHGSMIAGETGIGRSKTDKTVLGWFLFDCATGQYTTFISRGELNEACSKAGFSQPLNLSAVRDSWYVYWKMLGQ